MLEEEYFQKCIFQKEKLLSYGFQEENNQMSYQTILQKTHLKAILSYQNNQMKGIIIDPDTEEEYTAFRRKNQIGEFVNTVREEYQALLEDIKKNCTEERPFLFPQSNRISKWIKDTYQASPEFLWKEDDKDGVFRNHQNQKWYGIIMRINQIKLEKKDRIVEVMNVKLPPEEIEELVKEKGFYRAYHMNKKYWITFLLDDTIPDQKLKELIQKSYQYTIPKTIKK
ncbi:MAG: MmcQ/YjbR family DNA-binding protein [Bacilli bacterium]|nr:MmcQ/YjbR family DNA-binding protein [Bacilli bacterium]